MTYNYTNTSPMMTTNMSTTGTMPVTGTMMPYGTLGTYGNVNSYYTGGTNSVFDYALKSQDTNQTMMAQSMTNNYNNAYQGNVLAATATAQTAEVVKNATDICNIVQNNQLDQFKELWDKFETSVAKNPIYSQSIDSSNGKAVSAMAERVFQDITGYSIQTILKKTSDSSFMNGIKSGASLGMWGCSTSQDDALAYISKTDTKASSIFAESVGGGAIGGALSGSAGALGTIGLVDGVAAVFGHDAPVSGKRAGQAATVLAIVGAVAGMVSSSIKANMEDT